MKYTGYRKFKSILFFYSIIIYLVACRNYVDNNQLSNEEKNKKKVINTNLKRKEKLPIKEIEMGKNKTKNIKFKSYSKPKPKPKPPIKLKIKNKKIKNKKIKNKYISPLIKTQGIVIYKNGKKIKSNYKTLNSTLNKYQSFKTFFLKIGNTKYKVLKRLNKFQGVSSYLIKSQKDKFILKINSNGIPDNNQINNQLKVQKILKKIRCYNIPLLQKYYLEDDKENFVTINEYIKGTSMNLKFDLWKNNDFLIRKSLYQLLKFIVNISKKGIIMKNINLKYIKIPKEFSRKENRIKIINSKVIEIDKENPEKCFKENIKNLNMFWFWYKKAPNFINIHIHIPEKIMPKHKIKKEIIKRERIYMPKKKLNKLQIIIFHAFFKTLLHIYHHTKNYIFEDYKYLTSIYDKMINRYKKTLKS